MIDLETLTWPTEHLAEGLEQLAQLSGFADGRTSAREQRTPAPNDPVRITDLGARTGLELEETSVRYSDVARMLRQCAPAVLSIGESHDRFILLAGTRWRDLYVVARSGRLTRVTARELTSTLVDPHTKTFLDEVAVFVEEMQLGGRGRRRLVDAMVEDRLRMARLRGIWLVRRPAGPQALARFLGGAGRLAVARLLGAHIVEYLLFVLAWAIVGQAALQARFDTGWLTAWALILAAIAFVHMMGRALESRIALEVGAQFKTAMLRGALQLDIDFVRREGVGKLLGRVIEAQVLESLALNGGLSFLLAVVQLVVAFVVLMTVNGVAAGLLVVWSLVSFVLYRSYVSTRSTWTDERLTMTHELVERMLGHRTRLAQQPSDRWHEGEDTATESYLRASTDMDRRAVQILAFLPRAWFVVVLAGLSRMFVAGSPPATLAIAIGASLLAFRGFQTLARGLTSLAGAQVAWRQAEPMLLAGPPDASNRSSSSSRPGNTQSLLRANSIGFAYPDRPQPVLAGCSLDIEHGARLVVEGLSGSGKSTLAAVVAGLRRPTSGLVLLEGLDLQTLGLDEWRRRVVLVPQLHQNHMMLGPLAFNLLMGVQWPPGPGDLDRAAEVCRELGLGSLLDRMPGGLMQMVGETGWQLSQGEQARVFVARGLLQNPRLLILDESLSQLDPSTADLVLSAISKRPNAVLLVSH